MALTKISTDGIKDDAITSGKIPANAVGNSELANGAVTTEKIGNNQVTTDKIAPANVTTTQIADEAVTLAKLPHGTSSNDGKFLRANNGADPSFETVTSTTINGNAATKVILGSASANTLNASSNLIFDSGKLGIGTSSPSDELTIVANDPVISLQESSVSSKVDIGTGTVTGYINIQKADGTRNVQISADGLSYLKGGSVGIGLSNPESYDSYANHLVVAGSNHAGITIRGNYASTGNIYFADGTSGGEKYDGFVSYSYPTQRLALGTGGTTRVRVTNDGLCFHGDTAAANALDDYEEGTFTVTFHNTWTNMSASDVRHARYIKIGSLVHVYMEFFMTGNNGGWQTASYLGGFPFTGLSSYYSPVNLAVMYGPSGYDMDGSAAGRAYFDAAAKELYMRMGTFSGVRHLWVDFTYRTT